MGQYIHYECITPWTGVSIKSQDHVHRVSIRKKIIEIFFWTLKKFERFWNEREKESARIRDCNFARIAWIKILPDDEEQNSFDNFLGEIRVYFIQI